jgi:hypothetical protein
MRVSAHPIVTVLPRPSRPAVVAYNIKFICETSRFEARRTHYGDGVWGQIAINVERQI